MKVGMVAVSGYNTRAIIAFCRFASQAGLVVHLFARNEMDPILHTDYKSWVVEVRNDNALSLNWVKNRINSLKSYYGYEKILFLPSTEYLNRFLLKYRCELEASGVVIPLVDKEVYESVSDKYSFGRLCQERGLRVPIEITDIVSQFPVVAKPKCYDFSHKKQLKPHLLYSEKEYEKFMLEEDADKYYFQEFLAGESFYLLYYFSKEKTDVVYSQQNLIQQAGGGSIVCAVSSDIHDFSISEEYFQLFKRIGFFGFVMVEVRRCNGDYFMIEANPRFWGPMQLVVDSGLPFFRNFLSDNGIDIEERSSCSCRDGVLRYFWSGGIASDQYSNKDVVFHQYTPYEFFRNYTSFLRSDVYLKSDSIKLFDECLKRENCGE